MPDGHGHGHANSASAHAALPNHQLGEVLGRGAFGCVYRALKWQTGETVAVKQIELSNIPASELPEIMSEIDLLKNLDHPNVVQYRGFVKTVDFLWIILEYCENGSLTAICKKFGKFPESLCQIYICQVLEGLLYLHDQGVIHRDIKGSNILATKEGSVKLADFGVATRAGGLDRSVVGSPYWMAPEVVEQMGATTASDIWSVGCVVIELLEGQPPYHDLSPMPALFRIVNDDCPPLPDSASPVVRDFLLQCFQKDSNLRISARKLLKHPWMIGARRQLDATKRQSAIPSRPVSSYEQTVAKVQEWNKALDAKPNPANHAQTTLRSTSKISQDVATILQAQKTPAPRNARVGQHLFEDRQLDAIMAGTASPGSKRLALPPTTISLSRPIPEEEDKENDNWDNDFEEGLPDRIRSKTDLIPAPGEATEDCELDDSGDMDTIRPGAFGPQHKKLPIPTVETIVEDYSEVSPDNQDDTAAFEEKVANLKVHNGVAKRILHPRDLSVGSSGSVKNLSELRRRPSTSSISSSNGSTLRTANGRLPSPRGSPTSLDLARLEDIARFSEADSEDYSDVFGKSASGLGNVRGAQLELNRKLSSKSWLGDDEQDEEDPFAEVEEAFDDEKDLDNLEANVYREQVAKMCSFVNDLLDGMSAEADELLIQDGCVHLIEAFDQLPEVKAHFVRAHGMLTLIESLQTVRSRDVIRLELRILNTIIADDPDSLEKICLIGGCPVIMTFSHSRYSREIRLEAALFIGAMCRTSLLTLQMFISCRGLKTLVEMMNESYKDQKDLVWMAIDGIRRVFEMQGTTPRNDFCRMFAKEGLLDPLASALLSMAGDDDDLAASALQKVVQIFLLFSQSDLKVKMELAQRATVLRLVRVLKLLPLELLAPLLKVIKNVSMAPAALEILQHANAIETLVKIMTDHLDSTEICNPIVNALYNLCRLSKSRQEEAALAGAVPVLVTLVQGSSPLKQFALPILCDFAHASRTCRKILWQYKLFDLYISLLQDPFWSLLALESVLSWLQDETARIEDALLQDSSIEAILRTFAKAKSTSFENLLEPLLKILRLSPNLCIKLSGQASFFRRLIERLSSHTKAVVRLNLLRLVKLLFEAAPEPGKVARQANLLSTVQKLADHDPSLLVKNLARELGKELGEAANTRDRINLLPKRGQQHLAAPGSGFVPFPGTANSAISMDLRRTWTDSSILAPSAATSGGSAAGSISGSPASSRLRKLVPRPRSPNPGQPSASSSLLNEQGLPTPRPNRRISIRAKTSPK